MSEPADFYAFLNEGHTPEYLTRVASAGYPTVVVYSTANGDDGDFINWWQDETGAELADAEQEALESLDDDAFEQASDERLEHGRRITLETLSALRQNREISDLCELIDAASDHGSAAYPDSAAGQFLEAIAKLAWERLMEREASR